MPTLPNRITHEQAVESAITAEYSKLMDQAKANPAGVSWTASEDKVQREVADELATVFLLALAGMHKITGQDFNQYVALGLATDYANQRSANVVTTLYNDLRAKVKEAARNAEQSVLAGISPAEAKQRFEQELPRIFEPFRPATIGVTEVTAAISAGEYAVGKPDKDKWWLALVLLYGVPNAADAWRNRYPGQPVRELLGWPRAPRDLTISTPAPGEWPTGTPRRELPLLSQLPGQSLNQPRYSPENPAEPTPSQPVDSQTPPSREPDATSQIAPQIPSVLMPYWQTEGDSRVCSICSPLDGLAEDRYWDRFPGGPPAHPNCRCELRWVPFEALE